ncbi:HAD-like domain-containing protein [Abortiporus biennis]|nr:HAD-like domain-containing protein [Abortiporus biennis]
MNLPVNSYSRFIHSTLRASRQLQNAKAGSPISIQVGRRWISTTHNEVKQRIESPLAFSLDIDGVLIRGPNVLPAAKRALSMLEGKNPLNIKIPYILLTNGGGIGEEERCRKLTEKLGFHIKPTQYIQAHTILKSVVHKYTDVPILALGGLHDDIRKVAESYGFKKAYTSLDVHAWNPSVWPFHKLSDAERASTKPVDFSKTPIHAIFVFYDPRNWSLDIQIICDTLMSGGIIGGPYVKPWTTKIPLVFCNPDLIWRSDFDRPRLGQGAFREAFQAVFKGMTGSEYPHIQFGKPTAATYKFAEKVLKDRLEEIQGSPVTHMPHVYMVGDNPESDIAGANAAGWSSILVRTGVYDPCNGPPRHKPTREVEDIEAAVKWAIQHEMKKVQHG